MSTLTVDNLQTTGGASLFPARAWAEFSMDGTAGLNNDGGVSSLTDLGTGSPQFTLDNALSSATGYADICPARYTTTLYYPVQIGAQIASTTTVKGFCGSNTTTRHDWHVGYFAVTR